MKIIFVVTSFTIVWYMRYHKVARHTYDKDQDTLRHHFLVMPMGTMSSLWELIECFISLIGYLVTMDTMDVWSCPENSIWWFYHYYYIQSWRRCEKLQFPAWAFHIIHCKIDIKKRSPTDNRVSLNFVSVYLLNLDISFQIRFLTNTWNRRNAMIYDNDHYNYDGTDGLEYEVRKLNSWN